MGNDEEGKGRGRRDVIGCSKAAGCELRFMLCYVMLLVACYGYGAVWGAGKRVVVLGYQDQSNAIRVTIVEDGQQNPGFGSLSLGCST